MDWARCSIYGPEPELARAWAARASAQEEPERARAVADGGLAGNGQRRPHRCAAARCRTSRRRRRRLPAGSASMPSGWSATSIVFTTFELAKSITLTLSPYWLVTNARPPARATAYGRLPTGTVAITLRLAMSITLTSSLADVRGVGALARRIDGDAERARAHLDAAEPRIRRRVDEGHLVAVAVGAQHQAPVGRDGDARRRLPDLDLADDRAGRRDRRRRSCARTSRRRRRAPFVGCAATPSGPSPTFIAWRPCALAASTTTSSLPSGAVR